MTQRILLAALLSLTLNTPSAHAGRYPSPVHVLAVAGRAEAIVVASFVGVVRAPVRARDGSSWLLHYRIQEIWRGEVTAQAKRDAIEVRIESAWGGSHGADRPSLVRGARVVLFIDRWCARAGASPRACVRDYSAIQRVEQDGRVRVAGIYGYGEGSLFPLKSFREKTLAFFAPAYRAARLKELMHGHPMARREAVRQLAFLAHPQDVGHLLGPILRGDEVVGRMAASHIASFEAPGLDTGLLRGLVPNHSRSLALEALRSLPLERLHRIAAALVALTRHEVREVAQAADTLLRHLTSKQAPYTPDAWDAWLRSEGASDK